MTPTPDGITLKFRPLQDQTYRVDLEGPQGEDYSGEFTLPYTPATWAAILRALEPSFDLSQADDATKAALLPLEPLDCLPETTGQALAEALFADFNLLTGFNVALSLAEKERQPLPVELRFSACQRSRVALARVAQPGRALARVAQPGRANPLRA